MKKRLNGCVIALIAIIILLTACVRQEETGITVNGECYILIGYSSDYNIYISQSYNVQKNGDNSSYSYNYPRFTIRIEPLRLSAETEKIEIVYQNISLVAQKNSGERAYKITQDGTAEDLSITIRANNLDNIFTLEKTEETNIAELLRLLYASRGDRIAGNGRIEVHHLQGYGNIYLFAGYYAPQLVCAVLCDLDYTVLAVF